MDKEMDIDDLINTNELTYSDGIDEVDDFYGTNAGSSTEHSKHNEAQASTGETDHPHGMLNKSSDPNPFTHRAMHPMLWHAGGGEPPTGSDNFGTIEHPWGVDAVSNSLSQAETSDAPWTDFQWPQGTSEPQHIDGGHDELPPRLTHAYGHGSEPGQATYIFSSPAASPAVLDNPSITSQSGAALPQSPSPVHWHSALEESTLDWTEDSFPLASAAPTSTGISTNTLPNPQMDFPKLDMAEEGGSMSLLPTRVDDNQPEQDKQGPLNDSKVEDESVSGLVNATAVESRRTILPVAHPQTSEAALALDVPQHENSVKPRSRVNVIDLGDSDDEDEEEKESTIAGAIQDEDHAAAPCAPMFAEPGTMGTTLHRLPPSSGNKSDMHAEMVKEDTATGSSRREPPVSMFSARLASTLERVKSPADRLPPRGRAAFAMSAGESNSESFFDGDSAHDSAVDDPDEAMQSKSTVASSPGRSTDSTARGRASLLRLSMSQEQRLTDHDMADIAQKVKSELEHETGMTAPPTQTSKRPFNLDASPTAIAPDKQPPSPQPPALSKADSKRAAKFAQNSGSPISMPKKAKSSLKGKQKRGSNPRNLAASMVPAHLDNTGGSFAEPPGNDSEDSYPEPAKPPAKNLLDLPPPPPPPTKKRPPPRDIEILVALPEEEEAEEEAAARAPAAKRQKAERKEGKSHISRDLMDIVGTSVMGNLQKREEEVDRPRQTRGQKKEQEDRAPNAGAAAKKRHMKDGKLIVG